MRKSFVDLLLYRAVLRNSWPAFSCQFHRDQANISAIIAMAEGVNLKVIAEGVETKGQIDFLRGEKCQEVQQDLFSRPLSKYNNLDHQDDGIKDGGINVIDWFVLLLPRSLQRLCGSDLMISVACVHLRERRWQTLHFRLRARYLVCP